MHPYDKTVITFTSTKEAALYFDHIIPLGIQVDLMHMTGWKERNPSIPANMRELFPPDLIKRPGFAELFAHASTSFFYLALKRQENYGDPPTFDDKYLSMEHEAECSITALIEKSGLHMVPIIPIPGEVLEEDGNDSDLAITLPSLKLIDAISASWEHIIEFRRDSESRNMLRRLRLFAYGNYTGKSRDYIEDDLLKRVADYEETVKRWRFETKHGALTMLMTSKTLAGALTGSLISSLVGDPTIAISAAIGGVSLEVGRIGIELSKRRFALRNVIRDNPISYIVHAKEKLHTVA